MLTIHVVLKHLLAGAVFPLGTMETRSSKQRLGQKTVYQKVFPLSSQLSFPEWAADQVDAVALATNMRTPDFASGSIFM